jgi:predicted SAM-dependent methyltransferase
MNLRKILKKSHLYSGLELELGRVHTLFLKLKSRRVVGRYLRGEGVKKLQIGAGPTRMDGWLVTDIDTKLRRAAIYLDATKRFPTPDAVFDYVFSEHMIEHVPYAGGRSMLAECFRVLKPGARIRLATPDLDVLLSLKRPPLSAVAAEYVAWVADEVIGAGAPADAVHVINNQFRNYGHQFLYDERCLRDSLAASGFVEIARVPVGESSDAHFCNVEMHGKNMRNEAMNAFETLVLEARRPL